LHNAAKLSPFQAAMTDDEPAPVQIDPVHRDEQSPAVGGALFSVGSGVASDSGIASDNDPNTMSGTPHAAMHTGGVRPRISK